MISLLFLVALQMPDFSDVRYEALTDAQRQELSDTLDDFVLSGLDRERYVCKAQGLLSLSRENKSGGEKIIISEFRFEVAVDQKRNRTRILSVAEDVFVEGLDDQRTRRLPPGMIDVMLQGSDGVSLRLATPLRGATQGRIVNLRESNETTDFFMNMLKRRIVFNPRDAGLNNLSTLRNRGFDASVNSWSKMSNTAVVGRADIGGILYTKWVFPTKDMKTTTGGKVDVATVRHIAFRDGLPVKNEDVFEVYLPDGTVRRRMVSTVSVQWKKIQEHMVPVHLDAQDTGATQLEADFSWKFGEDIDTTLFDIERVGQSAMGGQVPVVINPLGDRAASGQAP